MNGFLGTRWTAADYLPGIVVLILVLVAALVYYRRFSVAATRRNARELAHSLHLVESADNNELASLTPRQARRVVSALRAGQGLAMKWKNLKDEDPEAPEFDGTLRRIDAALARLREHGPSLSQGEGRAS